MQRAVLYLLLVVVAVLRRPREITPVAEVSVKAARPVDLGTRADWALAGGW